MNKETKPIISSNGKICRNALLDKSKEGVNNASEAIRDYMNNILNNRIDKICNIESELYSFPGNKFRVWSDIDGIYIQVLGIKRYLKKEEYNWITTESYDEVLGLMHKHVHDDICNIDITSEIRMVCETCNEDVALYIEEINLVRTNQDE